MTEKHKEQKAVEKNGPTKESPENLEKRMSLYAYVIIGIIILILILTAGYLIWNQMNSHFNYKGIEFNRIVIQGENVYSTTFTTKQFINSTWYINNRTFYLRNNPKYLKLDRTIDGKVPIIGDQEVYISINEPLPNCSDRIRSLFDLSASLVNYGLQVRGAVVNQSKAQQNYTEITCANSTTNTVIVISNGNFTGFKQVTANCYAISFEECDDMSRATEGFTLKLLERLADVAGLNKKN